jgi:membrane protein DedA with SNARE-associated domain
MILILLTALRGCAPLDRLVMGVCFVAAVLGDSVNYSLGRWLGRKVFTEDSKIFNKEYITKTEAFYEKYGAKTGRSPNRPYEKRCDSL